MTKNMLKNSSASQLEDTLQQFDVLVSSFLRNIKGNDLILNNNYSWSLEEWGKQPNL